MSGTEFSSPIDFTVSDDEDDYAAASDMSTHSILAASLNRVLSDSSVEDLIDHNHLQVSIEEDILGPIKVRPTWSFGRDSKQNTSFKPKSMTPISSQDSVNISIESSQASRANEIAFNYNPASTRAVTQHLSYSTTISGEPNAANVYKLAAESSDGSRRSAKRPRYRQNQAPDMSVSLTNGRDLPKSPIRSSHTTQNNRNVIDIEALFPILGSVPTKERAATLVGEEVVDNDAETGDTLEDEHRYDVFESDYLSDREFEVFLVHQRHGTPDSTLAQSIQRDNVQDEMTEVKLTRASTCKRKVRAELLQAKIVPIIPNELRHGGRTYKAGKCVEFDDGRFMRIKSIHTDWGFWIKGDLFERSNFQGAVMPRRRNELTWIVIASIDPRNPLVEQAGVHRKITEVVRFRKINFTNRPYEDLNTRNHRNTIRHSHDDITFGELFCRLKRTRVKHRKDENRSTADAIAILDAAEADEEHRVDPRRLRDAWRGVETIAGGSYSKNHQAINLEDDSTQTIQTKQYTFGSAFCGAGGDTRGAVLAGLRAVVGFDSDEDAIMTYRANFERNGTLCYHEPVHEFIERLRRLPIDQRKHFMVDVLHISPPCQPFSPAHTRLNLENDAKNQACLFSVLHLLQTIKPRIVTVEETEGLISRHFEWLTTLIHIFVCVGYSVHWKVVRCEEYGVPQTRKRLYIIAAGPGEKLPEFATPTHGGQKGLVTIGDALRSIGPNAANQEIPETRAQFPRAAPDPESLAKTIMCSDGYIHPSGERFCTIRELGSLQTFPDDHYFEIEGVTKARKQIGNAVPPLLAQRMYQHIIQSLEEADGLRGRRD